MVQIQRRQPPGRFSIEGYFDRVREELSGRIDVSVYSLPYFSRGFWPRLANILAAFRHQADVTHVTGDIHYVTLMMAKRRTLLTVHDCEILERNSGWRRWILKLFWYTLPAKRVTAITVNSFETRRQLLKQISFPEDRIHVIPVPSSKLFTPHPKPFNSEHPVILQVGTKANKNLLRLAQALKGIPCTLHIVGPLDAVQREALEENQISFENYVGISDVEIVARYIAADIVSFVSTHEGFGIPIVEAQITERVCVTSQCSSMPEVAGAGACFVDPFDVTSIREGFLKVISSPSYRESLIQAGRENRYRFDNSQIADSFLAVFSEIHRQNRVD
ncbi:MAG: glycosyltransferase [Planctomycetaceae bacterium]